jgi:hypothetical protein
MDFSTVASSIVREAINSAIYIDDKVLLPYEDAAPDAGMFRPDKIFSSFRDNNCSLDIYRYDRGDFENLERLLYSNRDLLILDWHLDSDDEDNMRPTFEIMNKAIGAKNLHFCVIYTTEKLGELHEKVIYNIGSYFSGLTSRIKATGKEAFENWVDSFGLAEGETLDITNRLSELTKQFFFDFKDKAQNKKVSKEILDLINEFSNRDQFIEFLNGLDLPTTVYKAQLLCLGFVLNQCEVPEEANQQPIELSPDKNTVRVNHLYVKAYSKGTNGDGLYEDFKLALINDSNLFLTLLGLELRNRFRESSGFIVNDLEGVSNLAFFFHRKSHFEGHEGLFNEFLKDIWKDQVGSFLLEKNISLFDVIDEFGRSINIDQELLGFNKSVEVHRRALAQLNFVYNRLAAIRKTNDEIRFGDVFYFDVEGSARVFLLCVTPHCDCLRPGKIKNMFFFIEGKEIGIAAGVEKSDGDYISFIKNSGDLTCIDWTNGTDDCKPFTLYLPNHRMQGEDMVVMASVLGEDRNLVYLCSLKENYAQRIANKGFSYPLRVGIDFASFKTY